MRTASAAARAGPAQLHLHLEHLLGVDAAALGEVPAPRTDRLQQAVASQGRDAGHHAGGDREARGRARHGQSAGLHRQLSGIRK